MNIKTRLVVLAGALALMLAPTAALAAHGPEYETETPKHHQKVPKPGPNAPMGQKAKAYGRVCMEDGFSKKHVAGQKGTPFSQCVTAMAKAATGKKTARQACASFPKKHVAGQKGTPFSRCVAAAAKVKKQVS
jgi:hypothetical protein